MVPKIANSAAVMMSPRFMHFISVLTNKNIVIPFVSDYLLLFIGYSPYFKTLINFSKRDTNNLDYLLSTTPYYMFLLMGHIPSFPYKSYLIPLNHIINAVLFKVL